MKNDKVNFLIKLLNPKTLFLYLAGRNIIKISDEKFLKLKFKSILGYDLNLNNPVTFNEKLQWLKIYDRKSIYTTMADKVEAKKFVADRVGYDLIIPTYGVYNSFDSIDFENLPSKFVIKTNHDSSGCIVCKNKKVFNYAEAKKKINKNLKENYFYYCREWPYKNIKPKILIEKYIESGKAKDLIDYKFLCFNGMPKFVYVTIKGPNIFENYYDMNFNPVYINHGYPRNTKEFSKPKNFEKMIEIAKILSKNTPFLRVDLHNVNGKIYFGEMTFYDWAGFGKFYDDNDILLGKYIEIGDQNV